VPISRALSGDHSFVLRNGPTHPEEMDMSHHEKKEAPAKKPAAPAKPAAKKAPAKK